jgi:hypothetical protein
MKNSNRPKTRPDDAKQAAAFRKAARGLNADATDEVFRDVLRMVAKAKLPAAANKKKQK